MNRLRCICPNFNPERECPVHNETNLMREMVRVKEDDERLLAFMADALKVRPQDVRQTNTEHQEVILTPAARIAHLVRQHDADALLASLLTFIDWKAEHEAHERLDDAKYPEAA